MRRKSVIKSTAMVILMLNASIQTLPIAAYAQGHNNNRNNNRNTEITIDAPESFAENRKQSKFTDKKIEEELSNYTGIVDKEVEDYLNENGIFDEEIEVFDEDVLSNFEENGIESMVVYAAYYSVEDTEEKAGGPVKEEMIQLTDEEVNELIGEVNYGVEPDYEENYESAEESEKSFIDSALEEIGLKATDAYAATIKSETRAGVDSDVKTERTMLKKILTVTETYINGTKYYNVSYLATWTKMPEYRNLDVANLQWDGAFYDDCSDGASKTVVKHLWDEVT